jgi:hypothetical protein
LIRDSRTHEFFRNGRWTAERDHAQSFRDAAAVIRAASRYRLTSAELVLQVGEQPSSIYDVCLPLLDRTPAPKPSAIRRPTRSGAPRARPRPQAGPAQPG